MSSPSTSSFFFFLFLNCVFGFRVTSRVVQAFQTSADAGLSCLVRSAVSV